MERESTHKEPLNVLYLIRTWAFGGSHTIVLSLLEHLPRERFNVICVPYDAHSAGDAEFIARAIARRLPIADERIHWQSSRDWFRARRQVSALIETHDIDLLHTHDPHSNMMIGIGRKRWPVPVIASAYGWWDGSMGRRRLHQRIERDFALPKFDRVITVSNDMRGRILEGPTPPERVSVVPTGLPSPPAEAGALRARFNIPNEATVVGTVGRVSAEKGHRFLLNAANILGSDFPELYCVIVGAGPELDALKSQAAALRLQDRVFFTGFWENLQSALVDLDVFAFPSVEREGLPTAVLEAQQAGLPVVASDIGGTRDAMVDGETGVLVAPGNTQALADALRELVSNRQRRLAMGAAASAWIAENFTLDAMIQNVSMIYDDATRAYGHARSH